MGIQIGICKSSLTICRWMQLAIACCVIVSYLVIEFFSYTPSSERFVSVVDGCGPESIDFNINLDNAARVSKLKKFSFHSVKYFNLLNGTDIESENKTVDSSDKDEIDLDFGNLLEFVGLYDGNFLYTPDNYWSDNTSTFGCPCKFKTCIMKCCPPSQMFVSKEDLSCVDGFSESRLKSFIPNGTLYYNLSWTEKGHYLKPKEMSMDSVYLFIGAGCKSGNQSFSYIHDFDDGLLFENGVLLSSDYEFVDLGLFCMDYSTDSSEIHIATCRTQDPGRKRNVPDWFLNLSYFGDALTLLSLGATLFVYASLPQLQNLHEKIFMEYLVSYMLYYILTAYLIYGKAIRLMYRVNINWLTLISFDIWWTFSAPLKPTKKSLKQSDLGKFLLYSVIGWVYPVLLFSLQQSIQTWIHCTSVDCMMYKVRVDHVCDSLSTTCSLLMDVMFFLFTLYNMRTHFKQTKAAATSKSEVKSAREGYYLCLKLSIVMGFQWYFIFSVIIKNSKLLAILFVYVKSVIVFLLFVCNKRTLLLMHEKWLKRSETGDRNA